MFLCVRVVSPTPNPNPDVEDNGVTLCLVSTLLRFRHWWPYQDFNTPADIALGVTETPKLPHHDKVVTPFGALFIFYDWLTILNERFFLAFTDDQSRVFDCYN